MLIADIRQSHGLVHLQSITIVFLKIILANVSAMVNQVNEQNGQNMGYASPFIPAPESLT